MCEEFPKLGITQSEISQLMNELESPQHDALLIDQDMIDALAYGRMVAFRQTYECAPDPINRCNCFVNINPRQHGDHLYCRQCDGCIGKASD